jgi:hypothetical protein
MAAVSRKFEGELGSKSCEKSKLTAKFTGNGEEVLLLRKINKNATLDLTVEYQFAKCYIPGSYIRSVSYIQHLSNGTD